MAFAFAGGIAADAVVSADLVIGWAAVFIAAAALVFRDRRTVATILILTSSFITGIAASSAERQALAAHNIPALFADRTLVSGETVMLNGDVENIEPARDAAIITVKTRTAITERGSVELNGTVRLYLRGDGIETFWRVRDAGIGNGSVITAKTRLDRSERYLNPGVPLRTDLWRQQGIDAAGAVDDISQISVSEPSNSPSNVLFDRRASLIEFFTKRFDPSTAGVLTASLLGNKYFLDKPTAEVFREGGTFHILVISGLHITFIGGLALLFASIFTGRRTTQYLFACVFLWLYTFAVGAEVPVLRASVMFTVLLLSRLLNRPGNLLNAFGTCGLILLAWRPSDLFTPSFQLTFISVAALIGIAFPLIERLRAIGSWMPAADKPFPPNAPRPIVRFCEMLYWRPQVWKAESKRNIWTASIIKEPFAAKFIGGPLQKGAAYLFEGLLVSFVVQAFLLPVQVIYFNRVVFGAIFLNLYAGVMIAAESFAAIAAASAAAISEGLAVPFIRMTETLNLLLVGVSENAAAIEYFGLRLPAYSGFGRIIYAAYLLCIAAAAISFHRWNAFALNRPRNLRKLYSAGAAVIALLAAAILLHPFSSPAADGRLTVTFLDVDQGDAALIRFPTGETMLIDGGGTLEFRDDEDFEPDRPGVGEFVVSKFLWQQGISKIDIVTASHADADHLNGLIDIAKNFRIGTAFLGPLPNEQNDGLNRFAAELSRRNVPLRKLSAGDVFDVGGCRIEVLWPPETGEMSANDRSLVIMITFGDRSFLMTGDIEADAEKALSASSVPIRADVVKVAHHGSRSSSTASFVDEANGSIAIISAGRRSVYGHPHPEVVGRWKNAGTKVMRTSESGAITVATDGKGLFVSEYAIP